VLSAGTVMGWDVAGTVVQAAGDGSGPLVGSRVFGYTESRGAWAELVTVPTATLAVLPDGVTFAEGSTLGVAGLTALYALRLGGALLGRTVIVTGASGGVGRLAVQLAAMSGADVIAIVGTDPSRPATVTELGIPGLRVEQGLAGTGVPAHLILESVGGSSLSAAFTRVARGGVIVTYGRSSGDPGAVPPDWFFTNATLLGLSFSHHEASDTTSPTGLEILGRLVAEGRLDTGITWQRSWDEADSAIDALRERQIQGKAVLHIVDG
ncbi:MAG TPA: zinc-binding dehydrogenase, partial [Acidimicrobiales bacterium]|nr:zinc-binding dehydrogenase [Acidimicrobiales bacterium]